MTGADGAGVSYREDASGLTWRMWLALLAPPAVLVLLVLLTPVAVWSTAAGFLIALTVFVAVVVYQCWVTGIRIEDGVLRIGGCRRVEDRGPQERAVQPQSQFREVFSCPLDAVEWAQVIEPRDFDQYPSVVTGPGSAGRHRRLRAVGRLRTPLADAALVVKVDLSRAQLPRFKGRVVQTFYPESTSARYVATDIWTVPTRHPEGLRQVLTAAGLPAHHE